MKLHTYTFPSSAHLLLFFETCVPVFMTVIPLYISVPFGSSVSGCAEDWTYSGS